jgi:hypothetical protein
VACTIHITEFEPSTLGLNFLHIPRRARGRYMPSIDQWCRDGTRGQTWPCHGIYSYCIRDRIYLRSIRSTKAAVRRPVCLLQPRQQGSESNRNTYFSIDRAACRPPATDRIHLGCPTETQETGTCVAVPASEPGDRVYVPRALPARDPSMPIVKPQPRQRSRAERARMSSEPDGSGTGTAPGHGGCRRGGRPRQTPAGSAGVIAWIAQSVCVCCQLGETDMLLTVPVLR